MLDLTLEIAAGNTKITGYKQVLIANGRKLCNWSTATVRINYTPIRIDSQLMGYIIRAGEGALK